MSRYGRLRVCLFRPSTKPRSFKGGEEENSYLWIIFFLGVFCTMLLLERFGRKNTLAFQMFVTAVGYFLLFICSGRLGIEFCFCFFRHYHQKSLKSLSSSSSLSLSSSSLSQYRLNKVTSVFYTSVLVLMINCVNTSSKWLWKSRAAGEWFPQQTHKKTDVKLFFFSFTITKPPKCLIGEWVEETQ